MLDAKPRPIHPLLMSTTPRACAQLEDANRVVLQDAGSGLGSATAKAEPQPMPVLCACSDPRYGQNVQCNPERSVDAGGFRPPGPHSEDPADGLPSRYERGRIWVNGNPGNHDTATGRLLGDFATVNY